MQYYRKEAILAKYCRILAIVQKNAKDGKHDRKRV
jgi:hypothetical protein